MVEARYNIALVNYYQKKYNEAIRIADEIIEDQPEYSNAYLIAGDSYYAQNQYKQAMEYYDIAYQSGVRTKELCHIMAYIYDQQRAQNKAIPLYQESLSYDSSTVEIYQRLGELLPGQEGAFYRAKISTVIKQ